MGMPYKDVLMELELGLVEHAVRVEEDGFQPYRYDTETFRACAQIFMSALMWKLWEAACEKTLAETESLAEKCGNELRDLIMKFTGIDTHKLYGGEHENH